MNNIASEFERAFAEIKKRGATLTVRTDGENIEIDGDCNGAFVLMALTAIADHLRGSLREVGLLEMEINSMILGAALFDSEAYDNMLKETWS